MMFAGDNHFISRFNSRLVRVTDKSARGFTLIELLVVISIIAILMSVMMPALAKAREQAKKIVCASKLKQISSATVLYSQDNGGRLPERGRLSSAHMFVNQDTVDGRSVTYNLNTSFVDVYLFGMRENIMFCPGRLIKHRSSIDPNYKSEFVTYQYNKIIPPVGSEHLVITKREVSMPNISVIKNGTALWNCLTISRLDNNNYYGHDIGIDVKEPGGANAAFIGGDVSWVRWEDMEILSTSGNRLIRFYWPNGQ